MRIALSFLLMVALGTSALLVSSCQSGEDARAAHHERIVGYARRAADEMVYVRDERTGLCYAFWWQRYDRSGSPAIANVPCEAVRDLLVPPQ